MLAIVVTVKALFITDPLPSLDYPRDTSVSLMKEFFSQGQEVYHLDFFDISKLENLPVRKLIKRLESKHTPFEWGPIENKPAIDFQMIFHRKDPPVDALYKRNCLLFAQLPGNILQVNNPHLIATVPEKLIPLEFPEFSIPTQTFSNFPDFLNRIRSSVGEVVAKPIHLFSGYGVEFFTAQTPESQLLKYYNELGPDLIVQDFVPEAESIGDLRVLMFNGKILGSFLRRAAPGKRLQNLHQGGSIQVWEPNSVQKRGADIVGKALAAKSLFFLGVDFLGNRISEINVTSPMGTVQIDELYGTYCETSVYDDCIQLWKERNPHE